MEEKYGGAQEAMDLVYKNLFEQMVGPDGARKESTRGSASCRSTGRYSRPATSSSSPTPTPSSSRGSGRSSSRSTPGRTSDVQQALNDLVNDGLLTQTFAHQEYVMKGKDAYGNPIMVPPDPSVADEMERAKTVIYNLTPRALESFEMKFGPSKDGRPQALRVIEKLLKEEYWPMGYYCVGGLGRERAARGPTSPS